MGNSGFPGTRTVSGFVFRCRWLAQKGDWGFPVTTVLLFGVTIYILVTLNLSDPGILHHGSWEQDPETPYVAWLNGRAHEMTWCPHCGFHRPPRTFHCTSCNICVEEFYQHCGWLNNCVGHRNIRRFLLLLLSCCMYLGTVLAGCVVFLAQRRLTPFSLDKAMAYPHSTKSPNWKNRGGGEGGLVRREESGSRGRADGVGFEQSLGRTCEGHVEGQRGPGERKGRMDCGVKNGAGPAQQVMTLVQNRSVDVTVE
ncbi:putative palmitoyltransferase ZDHHC19 [Sciurus carolinensis]|uniref:Palmitoyltransferase n=1 Tax=Sciurus carolinensis TaxID=30640 RepID=A0AA41T9V1_SCICA|nr:putative palmitoyltransferase ZDHHC19 [Sciurus carolinensis]